MKINGVDENDVAFLRDIAAKRSTLTEEQQRCVLARVLLDIIEPAKARHVADSFDESTKLN